MDIHNRRTFLALVASLLSALAASVADPGVYPKGIMLNLDFQNIDEGLIPNKALYPLYVPLGGLATQTVHNRTVLAMQEDQHLDIPHSSLLDPDGSDWIVSVRVFALANGIVMSQCDDEKGYVVYIQDGLVHAAIRTRYSTVILKEDKTQGTINGLKTWLMIELRIKPDMATLTLNRARVALVALPAPLEGENLPIRIGKHDALPAPLEHNPTATPAGFSGAIASIKILRQ